MLKHTQKHSPLFFALLFVVLGGFLLLSVPSQPAHACLSATGTTALPELLLSSRHFLQQILQIILSSTKKIELEPLPQRTHAFTAPPAGSFTPSWDTTGESAPYLVAVNRQTQTVTVYQKDHAGNYTDPIRSAICSSGDATETGVFHTSAQYPWLYLFGDVYGQYATRIDGYILFHSVPYFQQDKSTLETAEFNKLGTPASLGCIRMQVQDAKWIYDHCPAGTPVVIFDGGHDMDPLGNPGFFPLDPNDHRSGWDPSDPDPNNPWHNP